MRQQPDRLFSILVLASMIAAIVASISARIVMRLVALTAQLPLVFTAATINILLIGFLLGLTAGIIYASILLGLNSSSRIRKHLPGPVWRGLIFGLLLLLLLGFPLFLGPSSPGDDINLGNPLLDRCMFAALPLIYGITLGGTEVLLDRFIPRNRGTIGGDTTETDLKDA
jgi:hypothetical protein